jgi:hypothetical protein
MNRLPVLFIAIFFIIAGIIIIVGTKKRWSWLVDPPVDYWTFYSHSFLKKFFGKTFLLYFNYFLGIVFILLSLIGFWNGIKRWG